MSAAGYSAETGAAVALAAATAKSVIGVLAGAAFGLQIKSFEIGFDGVTASGVPVLIELCQCTFATQPPGTLSTSVTPVQMYGRVQAAGFTAARDWSTTQPTVITVIKEFLLTPNAGALFYQYPLGQEPDSAFSQGFTIRCTAPAVVNVRSTISVERV
jgi:hypothetical protein